MKARIISVRNVNTALPEALWWLHVAGVQELSRNGPVVVAPGPVITEYSNPQERVLFSPARDANPFFHLMESLWMLAGRNDVEWLSQFNKRMATFSDDGDHFHGAYGFRWREFFGIDQLEELLEELTRSPSSRRCVLAHWSPLGDLIASEGAGGRSSKDLPCNTHCYLDLRGDALNLAVCCRSNDAVWGAYGANVVHFSMLQEYLAMRLRKPVGSLTQFSWNFHVYPAVFDEQRLTAMRHDSLDPYRSRLVTPYNLLQANEDAAAWERDLLHFFDSAVPYTQAYYSRFFGEVAEPMRAAWFSYKKGELHSALFQVQACQATDWRMAAVDWLDRRVEARRVDQKAAA